MNRQNGAIAMALELNGLNWKSNAIKNTHRPTGIAFKLEFGGRARDMLDKQLDSRPALDTSIANTSRTDEDIVFHSWSG